MRLLPLFILYGLFCMGCFENSSLAGGATETETGTGQVTGQVKWPDGRNGSTARVRLRSENFLAGSVSKKMGTDSSTDFHVFRDTVADSLGRFGMDSIAVGDYVVECLYPEGHAALTRFSIKATGTKAKLGKLILKPTGTITGTVKLADGPLGLATLALYGIDHVANVDSTTGYFSIPDLPQGIFNLKISSPTAFVATRELQNIAIDGNKTKDMGTIILDKLLKQDFILIDGSLSFPGISSANPVIYDNDFCRNMNDNEFIWALASQGKIDLRANLVTPVRRKDSLSFVAKDYSDWLQEAKVCRLSGMKNIPEPILGGTRKLVLPASGILEEIIPESNPGILLLVSEAQKASKEKPLLVITGGSLISEANAILIDPSIAEKMVVFGVYNQGTNGRDSLATYLVAKKCRFIEFGRNYSWEGPGPSSTALPNNLTGNHIRTFRDTANGAAFFTDFGPSAYLSNKLSWKSAQFATLIAAPLNVSLGTQGPHDFIEIPAEGNDWAVMDKEFFSVIGNSSTYHPWSVPGKVEAESFVDMSGIEADSIANENEIIKVIASGAWMEYSVMSATEGILSMTLMYQCDSAAQVRISGPEGMAAVDLDLAPGSPSSKWIAIVTSVPLKKGTQTIRLSHLKGRFGLSKLDFKAQ